MAGFNLPSITEFVNTNIEVFSQRYQRLLELYTQLATQGQAGETQVPAASAAEAPLRQEIRYIPPFVGAAIRRIFKL